MYGLSRMALEDIIAEEQWDVAVTCQRYAEVAKVAAEDDNNALGTAVATVVRLRIVNFLTVLDEVALPWKVTLSPEQLQENFNRVEAIYGRWWTPANKNHLAFLLHEVMTKAMELNDQEEL
jgi:hypothetical protein